MRKKTMMGCVMITMMLGTVFPVKALEVPYTEHITSQEDIEAAYQFELDGVTYALPIEIAELEENGWYFAEDYDAEYKMPGMTTTYMEFSNEKDPDLAVRMLVLNPSGNARLAKECRITGININQSYPGIEFKTVGGIGLGSTKKDVQSVYGLQEKDSDNYRYDLYKSMPDYEEQIKLLLLVNEANTDETHVGFKDNQAYDIEMAYYKLFDEDYTEVCKDRPEYLDEYYQVPTEISNDSMPLTYELDGICYSLPTPVSILEENGWTTKETDLPALQDKYSITFTKGEEKVIVAVQNDSDYLQNISDCYIYSIQAEGAASSFKTVYGISPEITETALLATFPEFNAIEMDGNSGSVYISDICFYKYYSEYGNSYSIRDGSSLRVEFSDDGARIKLEAEKWN